MTPRTAPAANRELAGALVAALHPILSRVRTDVCWKKTSEGPRRVDEALTDARMRQHVTGGPAFGAAPILPGKNTTLLAVLDFDSHKGDTPWPEMQRYVLGVCDYFESNWSMKPVAFRSSGGHGMHVYFLWDEPQDAYSVREALRTGLRQVGFSVGTGGVAAMEVEIFPKQDGVEVGRYGNMFVLPCAGASVPLDPFELDDLPCDYLVGMSWPMSAPVPVLEKPERAAVVLPAGDVDIALLRSALAGIPNEGDTFAGGYDAWRNIIFAIHHATNGSDVGLELAHEFSVRNPLYDPDFLDSRVWPYINSNREGAVTIGTILTQAKAAGWQEPAELVAADFDVVVPPPGEELPVFERDNKGLIEPTITNAFKALRQPSFCGWRVVYDTFEHKQLIAAGGTAEWRPFEDRDYTRLRIAMERGGFKKHVGVQLVRDALALVVEEDQIDSAQIWLTPLAWDGVSRVDGFLSHYLGAEDNAYVRSVSRYMWTAMAGRIMEPGVKADGVPILEGAQGIGKSLAVAALVPDPRFSAEISFSEKADDLSRKMRGTLVAEIGELAGLHSRDREGVKSFISRTHETWIPKYLEYSVTIPRRLIFIGTTNQREILADETGNRRWLPVHVTKADLVGIQRDRLQLWAEGREMFAAAGVAYGAAVQHANDSHESYRVVDSWEDAVRSWLCDDSSFDEITRGDGPRWQVPFTTADVAAGALAIAPRDINMALSKRIASVLRGMGFETRTKRVRNQPVRRWCYTATCCFLREVDGTDLV